MKKLFLLFFLIFTPFLRSHAQAVAINDTTRASFYCEAEGIRIYLDMGKESLTVPGMSFLGPVHAYMAGRIYGVWMLTKSERKGGTVILRFTNDIGSDSQTVELKPRHLSIHCPRRKQCATRARSEVGQSSRHNDHETIADLNTQFVLPHLFNLKLRHAERVLPSSTQ